MAQFIGASVGGMGGSVFTQAKWPRSVLGGDLPGH